jgi:hypothetical protein
MRDQHGLYTKLLRRNEKPPYPFRCDWQLRYVAPGSVWVDDDMESSHDNSNHPSSQEVESGPATSESARKGSSFKALEQSQRNASESRQDASSIANQDIAESEQQENIFQTPIKAKICK